MAAPVGNGQPWPAMANHSGHGRPWQIWMGCDGRAIFRTPRSTTDLLIGDVARLCAALRQGGCARSFAHLHICFARPCAPCAPCVEEEGLRGLARRCAMGGCARSLAYFQICLVRPCAPCAEGGLRQPCAADLCWQILKKNRVLNLLNSHFTYLT